MYATLFLQALGPTEAQIMHQLWEHGPAMASELHEALRQQRTIAYSTVKTTVDRLCEKGIVRREALADRAHDPYLYSPTLTRAELIAVATLKMCADLAADAADRRAVREALGA